MFNRTAVGANFNLATSKVNVSRRHVVQTRKTLILL